MLLIYFGCNATCATKCYLRPKALPRLPRLLQRDATTATVAFRKVIDFQWIRATGEIPLGSTIRPEKGTLAVPFLLRLGRKLARHQQGTLEPGICELGGNTEIGLFNRGTDAIAGQSAA